MANNTETIDGLNNVLEYLHDSRDGYRECAEEVSEIRFKDIFNRLVANRQNMISNLQLEIKRLGGDPEKAGTTLAAGHRLFIDLKSLLTGGDTEAIIKEINRGENYLIEKYKDALLKDIDEGVKQVLKNQLREIENHLSTINAINKAVHPERAT